MSTTQTAFESSTATAQSSLDSPAKRYPYIAYDVDPCEEIRGTGNSRLTQNVRTKRPDLVADVVKKGRLTDEISMIAVAEPEEPGGKLQVLVGFHRHATAVTVKENEHPDLLVNVVVFAPGTKRKDVLYLQGKENINRVGLTAEEEGGLYLQLNFEGADDEEIADEFNKPIERIRAGRAVASNPRTRDAAKVLPTEDLMILAELAKFEHLPEVHDQLVQCLHDSPQNFTSVVNRARTEIARAEKHAELTREFTDRGYVVLEDDDDLPDTTAELTKLCDWVDTSPLEVDDHAECKGRAVYFWVGHQLSVRMAFYCVDYAKYGHRSILDIKIAQEEARLAEAGVELADPEADGVAELVKLASVERAGFGMLAAEHEGCPGHAAYVTVGWRSPEASYVCRDYAAHGHILRDGGGRAAPQADPEFVSAERKRTKANNDLWEDRTSARRAWLQKLFSKWRSGKLCIEHPEKPGEDLLIDLPARLYNQLLRATILASDHGKETQPGHDFACGLLGLTKRAGAKHPIDEQLLMHNIGHAQALIIHLAQVLGAGERYFDWSHAHRNADSTWRKQSRDTRFYFELLRFLGYPAEHVEQLVLDISLDNAKWPHLAPKEQALGAEISAAA